MKKLACRISVWSQKKLGLSEDEFQVIEYGMEIFLDGVFKLLLVLGAGVLIGRAAEITVFLMAFCGLRCWAGGVHCRTAGRCTAAMVAICLIGSEGQYIFEMLGMEISVLIWIGCIITLALKAPGETGKNGYFSKAERRKRKWKAVLCGMILCGCFAVIPNIALKGAIVMAVVVETLSILPCKGNKNNTADEKERKDEETKQTGSDSKENCRIFC